LSLCHCEANVVGLFFYGEGEHKQRVVWTMKKTKRQRKPRLTFNQRFAIDYDLIPILFKDFKVFKRVN
jgi:hypothetical protein